MFLFYSLTDYRESELATSMGCGMFLNVIQDQMFLEVEQQQLTTK